MLFEDQAPGFEVRSGVAALADVLPDVRIGTWYRVGRVCTLYLLDHSVDRRVEWVFHVILGPEYKLVQACTLYHRLWFLLVDGLDHGLCKIFIHLLVASFDYSLIISRPWYIVKGLACDLLIA